MRASFFLLLLLVANCLPATGDSVAALRIVEVHPDPDASGREFIELANLGTTAVDLAGWRLRDAPTASGNTNTYTFPVRTLLPGGRVVVWGGGLPEGQLAWSQSAVWNNAGDTVLLLDPTGAIHDAVAYGAGQMPEGWTQDVRERPPRGQSLHEQGGWIIAAPTPGLAFGAVGGIVHVEVANLPPTAGLEAPATVRPGATATVRVHAGDGNGPADVVSWRLFGPTVLAQGASGGTWDVVVTAPQVLGPWLLRAEVTDSASLTVAQEVLVDVRTSAFQVQVSSTPWVVGPAEPGHALVATIVNEGEWEQASLLDLAPLVGPQTVEAARVLEVGWTDGNVTQWWPYDGPLAPLPPLAPHATATLHFRLRSGAMLAAGSYALAFSLVQP